MGLEMRSDLFDGIDEEELRGILSGFTRRKFARGEVVFHEGDPADTLHLVARGYFAAQTTTRIGQVATFAVMGPGAFFGELALLATAPRRTATVVALEDAETRSIHHPDLARLREAYPSVNEALIRALVRQVERLSHRVTEALFVPAEQRLLRRLGELAGVYGTPGEPAVIPLTQEELAAMAGTSRATVNRVLGEQESHGAIARRRGTIVVLDPEALARTRPRS